MKNKTKLFKVLIIILAAAAFLVTACDNNGTTPEDNNNNNNNNNNNIVEVTTTIPGSNVQLTMVRIDGGSFTMGSPDTEASRLPNEGHNGR